MSYWRSSQPSQPTAQNYNNQAYNPNYPHPQAQIVGSATPATNDATCGDCVGPKCWIPLAVILGIGCLLILILVPLSVQYNRFDQISLEKNRVGANVDSNGPVRGQGRYWLGPTIMFQHFDGLYKQIVLNDLSVVASNSVGFRMDVAIQFRINPTDLGKLFDRFNLAWESPATNEIISAIKSETIKHTVETYTTQIEFVRKALENAIVGELAAMHIELKTGGVQIMEIVFQQSVVDQFLRQAVQDQKNEEQQLQQEVDLIEIETEILRQNIEANATRTTETGKAQATAIVTLAQATANRIKLDAETLGFTALFDQFGVTDPNMKREFLEWYNLAGNPSIQILSGVANAIANVASSA